MKDKSRRKFLVQLRNILAGMLLCNVLPLFNRNLYAKKTISRDSKTPPTILIIFASHHGSTAQIAKYMERRLKQAGIHCETKSITEKIDLNNYDSIIIGSPIHRGQWMASGRNFVNHHRNALSKLPTACFFTCMAKACQPPTKDAIKQVRLYQEATLNLFPGINPDHIGIFAGKIDFNKCSFFTKLVMKYIMKKNKVNAGDHRDWVAIDSWLQNIKFK